MGMSTQKTIMSNIFVEVEERKRGINQFSSTFSERNAHLVHRNVNANPNIFATGDIVELQVSFEIIPAGEHFRMLVVLRSLKLLDDRFSKASTHTTNTQSPI